MYNKKGNKLGSDQYFILKVSVYLSLCTLNLIVYLYLYLNNCILYEILSLPFGFVNVFWRV